MEINRQAPAVAEKEIRIDASPADVWKVHADINGWHTWNPDISTSKLVGELSPGSEFKWTSGGVKITSTLEEVEESRRISWTGRGAGTSARHRLADRSQAGRGDEPQRDLGLKPIA